MTDEQLKDINVLFVDDDEVVREVFETIMAVRIGIGADVCKSANDALLLLRCREYDVVITDICMTEMDGIELAEIVLEKYKIPVVLVTGHAPEDVMPLGFESRAICCLHKPCTITAVIDRIKEALLLKEVISSGDSTKSTT